MKFNPFFKSKKTEYFLTIDVGTETIKGLVFSILNSNKGKEGKTKKIVIHGVSTQYFDEFGVFDTTRLREEVLKRTISKTIKEIKSKAEFKKDSLLLGLPANVLRARLINQNFKRENPKKTISEIEDKQIHKTVFDRIKIKLSKQFAKQTGLLPEDFYFHNLKVLAIRIDGYEIPSLLGLNGEKLEFEVLATFLSKHYFEEIKKIFQDFNFRIYGIVHEAETLSFLFPEKNLNAIFLDIGGELTKIILVEKGKLKGISEFKMGGLNFTQRISRFLGLNLQRARVLKHNFSQSGLSRQTKQKLKEILSPDIKNWFQSLKENLKEFSPKLLPSNIFLFGGGSLIPDIPTILKNGYWSDLPAGGKPKVKLIYPKDIKNIENKSRDLNSPQQIPLILISYEEKEDF